MIWRSANVAVCPAAYALAERASTSGRRAVALPAGCADASVLRGLLNLGLLPIVAGDRDDSLRLARELGPACEIAFVPDDSIALDASRRRVTVRGRERHLGTQQTKLLAFLIENAGRIVEAGEAARHLFGLGGKDEVAALRVHLHNLRKKIENDPSHPRHIVTVPTQGYLFVR